MGRVNITGGEPLLRRDLAEIVDILAPKAHRLEISTNGYFTDRLVEIGRRHPEHHGAHQPRGAAGDQRRRARHEERLPTARCAASTACATPGSRTSASR